MAVDHLDDVVMMLGLLGVRAEAIRTAWCWGVEVQGRPFLAARTKLHSQVFALNWAAEIAAEVRGVRA